MFAQSAWSYIISRFPLVTASIYSASLASTKQPLRKMIIDVLFVGLTSKKETFKWKTSCGNYAKKNTLKL